MSKFTWQEPDLIALMAWLDFCRETNLNFNETITVHLAEKRKQNFGKAYHFTLPQVKNKLRFILRQTGVSFSMESIRKHGSKTFSGLPEAVRKGIGPELRRYKAAQGEIQRTIGEAPRRAAVTASKAISKIAADDRSVSSEQQRKTEQGLSSSNEQPIRTGMNASRGLPTQQQVRKEKGPSPSKKQPMPPILPKVLAPVRQNHEEILKQKQMEIKTMRQHWQEETEQLKAHKRKFEQVEKDLLAKISHLEMAARDISSATGRDPMEYELYLKNKQIFAHEDRIQKMQAQMRFTNSSVPLGSGSESGRKMEIDNTMNFFQAELDSILHGHGTSTPLRVPSAVQSNDLGSLIRSVHGYSALVDDEATYLRHWALKFEPEVVVKTLALAAVREWVFGSSFPNFAPNESWLMQAYRKALILQDGWRNLHNLELTAYHSLIEGDDLQHTIVPTKAKEYAARFSAALAVLFTSSGSQTTDSSFHAWGQNPDVSKNRQYRLTAIFEAALRLKASTVTSEQAYEFLVYPPGTSQKLDSKKSGGVPGDSWVHASMHTYARANAGLRGELLDALIQSKNFVNKNVEQRERIGMSLNIKYISTPRSEDPRIRADVRNGQGMNVNDPADGTDVGADEMVLDSEDEDEDEDAMSESPRQATSIAALQSLLYNPNERVKANIVGRATAHVQNTTSLKKLHPEGFACETCNKKFTLPENLNRHKRTEICSVCPSCKKGCRSKEQRRRHETEHAVANNKESELQLRPRAQPDATRPAHRPQPDSTLQHYSQSRTSRHTRSMSSMLPPTFKCDICDKDGFQDMKRVKVHKARSHKRLSEQETDGALPATEKHPALQPRTTRRGSSAQESEHAQGIPEVPGTTKGQPQPRQLRRGSSAHEIQPDRLVQKKPETICSRCGKYYLHPKALQTHMKNEACVQCKHCGTWIQDRSQLVQHIRRNHPLEQESSSSSSESEESLDLLSQPPHTAVQHSPTPHQSRHQALSCHDRHQSNKEGNNKPERSNDQPQSDTAHSDGPARALSPPSNMSVLISSRRASETPETILNHSDEIAQAHASASSFSASHRHIVVNKTPPSHPTAVQKSFSQDIARFSYSRQITPGRFDRGHSRQPTPFNSDGNRCPPGTNQICRRDGHLIKASDMRTGQDSGPCSRCGESTTAQRIRKNIQLDAVSADTTPTQQRMDMGAHQRDLPASAPYQMSRLAADSIPSGYVADAAAAHVKTPERPLLAPPENLGFMGRLGR